MNACFMDFNYIWMRQPRHGLSLNSEAFQHFRVGKGCSEDNLYRHDSRETNLSGLEDYAHPAPRNLLQQLIVAELERQFKPRRDANLRPIAAIQRLPASACPQP